LGPMCLFASVEYAFPKMRVKNFLAAKATALYMIPIIIGLLFYAYTAMIGTEILLVDILIFLAATASGQLVSYRIMKAAALPRYTNIIAGFMIVLLALITAIFTFFPPHLPIFMDQNSGTYGILR
jgi:hypothetical protein